MWSDRHRLPGRPWIWIDLDDTLWDFRANSLEALADVYASRGLDRYFPTLKDWYDAYHAVNDRLWALYSRNEISRDYLRMERFRVPFVEAGCEDGEARRLSSEMDHEYLDNLAGRSVTVDGALDLLRYLKPIYNIGILSNGFRDTQHGKMESSGIAPYADIVVLSDDIEVNKPDIRIFRHAEERAGVSAADCVMLGDNPLTDIAGALNAGWKAVWFNPACADMPAEIAGQRGLSVISHLDEFRPGETLF